MRQCKNCKELIRDELEVCPFCGYIDIRKQKTSGLHGIDIRRIPIWVKIIVPIVLVLLVVSVAYWINVKFKIENEVIENDSLSESAFESNTGMEPEETVLEVDVVVLNIGEHSYACYFGCTSWEQARDYCESVGGHLAVITSQDENDTLYAFARYCGYDNVYIGYSDIESEGNFQWVNGEVSDYTNWNPGEPNGFTSSENYAVLVDNGCWNDGDFSPRIENGLVSFICEWDHMVLGIANLDESDMETDCGFDSGEVEDIPIETIATMLTEDLAIQAFENYWNESFASAYADINIEGNPGWWFDGCYGDYCKFYFRSYTGAVIVFYTDLNSGLTQSATYYNSALSTINLTEVYDVNEYVFNSWDFLPDVAGTEYGVDGFRMNDAEQYDMVMSFVAGFEASFPNSRYAVFSDYVNEMNNSYAYADFPILHIQRNDGELFSYAIDEYGLVPLDMDFSIPATYEFVTCEEFISYPYVCRILGFSFEDVDLMVRSSVPDGTYYGSVTAISEDGRYALVRLGDQAVFTPEEISTFNVGDTLPFSVWGRQPVVTEVYSDGSIEIDNGNSDLWVTLGDDGNYYLITNNDDVILINEGTFLLPISDNVQFEESDVYENIPQDEMYNSYISEYGYYGNPILDSYSLCYMRSHRSSDRVFNSNGYLSAGLGITTTIVNNEIVYLYFSWHP